MSRLCGSTVPVHLKSFAGRNVLVGGRWVSTDEAKLIRAGKLPTLVAKTRQVLNKEKAEQQERDKKDRDSYAARKKRLARRQAA